MKALSKPNSTYFRTKETIFLLFSLAEKKNICTFGVKKKANQHIL